MTTRDAQRRFKEGLTERIVKGVLETAGLPLSGAADVTLSVYLTVLREHLCAVLASGDERRIAHVRSMLGRDVALSQRLMAAATADEVDAVLSADATSVSVIEIEEAQPAAPRPVTPGPRRPQ